MSARKSWWFGCNGYGSRPGDGAWYRHIEGGEEIRPTARDLTVELTSVVRTRTLPRIFTAGHEKFRLSRRKDLGGLGFLQVPKPKMGVFSAHGDVPLISPDRPLRLSSSLAVGWLVRRTNQLRQLIPTGSTRYDSRKQPWLVLGTNRHSCKLWQLLWC